MQNNQMETDIDGTRQFDGNTGGVGYRYLKKERKRQFNIVPVQIKSSDIRRNPLYVLSHIRTFYIPNILLKSDISS